MKKQFVSAMALLLCVGGLVSFTGCTKKDEPKKDATTVVETTLVEDKTDVTTEVATEAATEAETTVEETTTEAAK